MVDLDIQSKEVIDKISDELKVQPSLDIPRRLAEKINLVYGVNPRHLIKFFDGVTGSSTGSVTLGNTSPTKRTFITNIRASYIKDVVCDSASGEYSVNLTPVGVAARSVARFPIITLTVQSDEMNLRFDPPIEIEKGTAIFMTGAFTAGVCIRSLDWTGYTTDPQ